MSRHDRQSCRNPSDYFLDHACWICFAVGSFVGITPLVTPFFQLGLRILAWIATQVSAWPLASLAVPFGAPWALNVTVLSGLWFFVWKTKLRLASLPFLAVGFWGLFDAHPPKLFMDGEGKAIGFFEKETATLWTTSLRRGTFAQKNWMKVTGAEHLKELPFQSGTSPWICQGKGCFYHHKDINALISQNAKDLPLCRAAHIVCSLEPLRGACKSSAQKQRLDRFTVWREGSLCVWKSDNAWTLLTSRMKEGGRPWTPSRYKKNNAIYNATHKKHLYFKAKKR